MARLIANIIVPLRVTVLTGLHIGTSSEHYEIGGMDNPIIRYFSQDSRDKGAYPYIPGSSLKGKMRSLLEWATGGIDSKGEVHSCARLDCSICRIFGSSNVEASEARTRGPARLIVRDAFPTDETKEFLDYLMTTEGLNRAEIKHENCLNRLTAEANPRQMERVPPGSEFDGELVYSVLYLGDTDKSQNGMQDVEDFDKVIQALRLVQDTYLGGCGTRGYGQVEIKIQKPIIRTADDYKKGFIEEGEEGRKEKGEWMGVGSPKTQEILEEVKRRLMEEVQKQLGG